jgi:Tol biopolymer transport system component
MLVMGDSYSAGNGGGSYYGATGCFRSAHNYARQFERKIEVAPFNQRGFVENVACSGDVSDAFFETTSGRPPQLDAVNSGYDLIFLTIGGNDIHFGDIVWFCLIGSTRDGANCGPNLTRAEQMLDEGTVYRRIYNVLHGIQTRAAATAKIVLLGYPHLEGDVNYRLRSGHFGNTFIDVGKRIRAIGDKGEQIQKQVVKDLNSVTPGKPFVFVSVQQLFDGPPTHVLFAQSDNPKRWMVQPRIDAPWALAKTFYHPNPTGWDQEATLLLNNSKVPKHPLPQPKQPVTQQPATGIALLISAPPDLAVPRQWGPHNPIWSFDGKWLAFQPSNSRIATHEMATHKTSLLVGDANGDTGREGITWLAWSPHANLLAYLVSTTTPCCSSRLYLRDLETRSTTELGRTGNARSPAWSANGQVLSYSDFRDGRSVFVLHDVTNASERIIAEPTSYYALTSPAWSPDGHWIARTTQKALWLTDVQTGTSEPVVESDQFTRLLSQGGGDTTPLWSPDSTKIAFWKRDGKFTSPTYLGSSTFVRLYVLDIHSRHIVLVDNHPANVHLRHWSGPQALEAAAQPLAADWTGDSKGLLVWDSVTFLTGPKSTAGPHGAMVFRDLERSKATLLADNPSEGCELCLVRNPGSNVFAMASRGRVDILRIDRAAQSLTTALSIRSPETYVRTVRWSPDGRWVAFATGYPAAGNTGMRIYVARAA